ncbi:hypothetical protein GUITHDRAFT_134701 [Guillardia theta CCMP2712]|uniref:PDZ domain-containing protein n=1 Tax=Guillardia theta (strain CCMP2712) TaxID=905079 RepID=L1JRW5_GUITC|nr:hypothetical protein GUITHDRAFT_134701 [Guillardia theta CCMP2712]EKX51197.1 hypothetical protein GUITHDRAFT_134701 [Guillardia theta CCMP2712]|eukprot:XP_005838177.1 hypothetical protein GUITHDRAFT_134701 [Guillardia theta CCMP2712]
MAGLLWVGMRWAMAEGGGGGVGLVLRRRSEQYQDEIQELRGQLKVMEEAECSEEELIETGPEQRSTDPERDRELLEGCGLHDRSLQDEHISGLSAMGATGSRRLQVVRCRYCMKAGDVNVMKRCGKHHKEGCLRYVTCPQDLVNKVARLKGELSAAISRAEASARDDCVVVARRHAEGPACRCGEIDNGDVLVAVDNHVIGTDVHKASRLILGSTGTVCRLKIRKESGVQKEVHLTRVVIWGHSAPAGLFAPEKNYIAIPSGVLC